jgi:hypothetical protein
MCLRRTKKNWQAAKDTALQLKEIINRDFSSDVLNEKFIKALELNNKKQEDIIVL